MIDLPIWVFVSMILAIVLLGTMLWTNLRERDFHVRVPDVDSFEEALPSIAGMTRSVILEGNRAEILQNGDGFFPVLLDCIARRQGDDPLRDLRLVVRRHLRPGRRRFRGAGPRGPRGPDHGGRPGRHEVEGSPAGHDDRGGLQADPLPPHPPHRHRAAQQAHPPQARHLRRPGGPDLRPRHLAAVAGQRRGQGPLARHRRAAPGADRQRRAVRLHPALGGGDRRGAGGGEVFPAPGAGRGSADAHALRRSPGRHLGPRADVQDGHRLGPERAAHPEPLLHRGPGDGEAPRAGGPARGGRARSWCPARSPTAPSSATPDTATSARCSTAGCGSSASSGR